MLNHEQLMELWKVDCDIDRSDLTTPMYEHPMLHSKYLSILMGYKNTVRKYTKSFQELSLVRQRYFNGEMTKEELDTRGWKQYLFKRPMNSEREALLDASPDLQELQEKTMYTQNMVEATEYIMKDINQRYFLFKNLVEYEKFKAGV